jgi:glucosyl-dolichyl phosphate glucuronosyltransferase
MNHILMSVAVVICIYTEDRWEIFVKAVESVQAQTLLPDPIVIVSDHNPRLLERAREHFPNLIVTENKEPQGLSGGRNTGIAASNTDLIAFLDDDAVAEPDWLERMVRCCDDPRVLGAGGRTEPLWMVKRPGWLPDEFFWTLSCSWRGLPEQRSEVRNPTGGNMVLRRKAFDEVGNFRIGIGRVGTIPLGCEETELCIRMRQRWPEKLFLFEPAAVIRHQVTAPRATWRYFCRRCYAEGLSKALVSRFVGANDGLSAERRHVLKVLPSGVLREIGDTLFHFDLWGIGRAAAIVLGTLIAAAGYIIGRWAIASKVNEGKWLSGQDEPNSAT